MVGTTEMQETGEDVFHLNPGDILEISFDLENQGNKSAWLRHLVNLTIVLDEGTVGATGGAFELHARGTDRDNIRYTGVGRATPLEVATIFGFEYISDTIIINGSGDNAEIEGQGEGPELTIGFYIYFVPTAGMEYQNVSITFGMTTQAMQYRNNPNPDWANVVDQEFVLGDLGTVVVIPATRVWNNDTSAYWSLYDNGTVVVGPGSIHWTVGNGSSPWNAHRDDITRIVFTGPITVGPGATQRDMAWLFGGLQNLVTIDGLEHFDTSLVRNMNSMFMNASSLEEIDLSGWDTSNVTNMSAMFRYASSLTCIGDVSNWNTSSATTMSNLFRAASSLEQLELSGWTTDNVTNMTGMFLGTTSLENLDGLSGWNTSNVTNMSFMFSGAQSLTTLELSGWNVSNVTNMESMFNNMRSLVTLDLAGWDVGNIPSMANMFRDAESLVTLDLTGWNTGNVTSMSAIFLGANSLENLHGVSGWDVSSVTNMSFMFSGANSLEALDLSSWDTGSATNMDRMFANTASLSWLALGQNFVIPTASPSPSLPAVPNNALFTGLWTNVGISNPAGTLTFSSANLINHLRNNPANETWVWEAR